MGQVIATHNCGDGSNPEQAACAECAPRVYGSLALGFDRTPFEVTRCEFRVKGVFLRAIAPGKDLRVGSGLQVDLPSMPSMALVVIEHPYEEEEDPNSDFYILDWRSSRQPRAVPIQ